MNYIPKVHDLEQAYGVTWHELAGREPGLEELLWQARADGARCSNHNAQYSRCHVSLLGKTSS